MPVQATVAVIAATRQAVERARRGEGPTLVEAVTFRMGGHSSSDDPTRYRDPEVVKTWEQRDPVARFGTWLRGKGLLRKIMLPLNLLRGFVQSWRRLAEIRRRLGLSQADVAKAQAAYQALAARADSPLLITTNFSLTRKPREPS